MNKKDPNYIAALERAIREKFGDSATVNPKFFWDPIKEEEYIKDVRETLKREAIAEQTREKEDLGGILIPKKLINKNNKSCSVCKEYSFNKKDDVYLNKYAVCMKCYVQHIEDREERWASGWRPNGDK
jgi:hypothetical protein